MDFLKRIANSQYCNSRFRWPSAKTLRVYAFIVALFGCGNALYAALDVYRHAVSTGLTGPVAGFWALAVSLMFLVTAAFIGLMFLVIWGLYYRLGTDMVAGFRRFIAWAPGALQSFGRGLAAIFAFVCSIPSLIGRFFRAIGRAFLWLAGRPAWWRGLTRKQKGGIVASTALTTVYLGVIALFYPVARHISAALPSWAMMSDTPFLQTLFIDMFLGSILGALAIAILSTVVSVIARSLFKK